MSQPLPPEESEPATGPVLSPPTPTSAPDVRTVYLPQPPSRLNKAAAWVGIAAGSVFVVAVIFGTGVFVGKNIGSERPHAGPAMMLRPGPAVFPMGPPGGFDRGPGFSGPFGQGGPMIDLPRPPAPNAPPR